MSELYCPKCGSDKLTANEKGFSAGKAIVGGVLTGGIGLIAGFHGKGKVNITCLSCGTKFKPGQGRTTPLPKPLPRPIPTRITTSKSADDNAGCIVLAIVIVVVIVIIAIAVS